LALTGVSPVLQVIDNSVGGGHDTVYYQGVTVPGTQQVIFGTLAVGTGIYTGGAVNFPSYDFILRVSNIRVNVTGLLNPNLPTPVTEQVFAGAQGVATLFQSNPIVVGYVLKSLNVSLTSVNYLVCLPSSSQSQPSFDVAVSELFAGAFKTPNAPAPTVAIPYPANIPGGEQGTFPTVGGIEANPLGTRIKFVVANIPSGVTALSVLNAIYGRTGQAHLELDLVSGGDIGTALSAGSTGSTSVAVSGGTVTVIYQVNTEDLSQIKTFDFAPSLVFGANQVTLTGTPSQINVTTSYAPSPATPGGTLTVPTTYLPYFANTGVPMNATLWNVCQTTLLFPFVSTNGVETGIAISNTSIDPGNINGGTAVPNTGACTLNFYGTVNNTAVSGVTGLPAPNPTGGATPYLQAAGTTNAFAIGASSLVPANFSGYLIAQCNYLYAHGFAYIAYQLGTTNGSTMGYVANVLVSRPITFPAEEALDN
jgi:hypothetical protein